MRALSLALLVGLGRARDPSTCLNSTCLTGPDATDKPPWPAPWPAETVLWTEHTAAPSRCTVGERGASCSHDTVVLSGRTVHFERPVAGAKVKGTVFLFHGWNLYSDYGWESETYAMYGTYNKVRTIKALLDAGYIVVAPNAQKPAGYWDTNQAPYNTANLKSWARSPDDGLVNAMLKGVEDGTFGRGASLDSMHAIGFSSGGYMTSRMAYNYPGSFRSLVVCSGAYFYCGGSYCPTSVANELPTTLTANHPPTLFLHGTSDSIVPFATSAAYHKMLQRVGVETKRVSGQGYDHQWLYSAPDEVLAWVERH